MDKSLISTELVRINQHLCKIEAEVRSENPDWSHVEGRAESIELHLHRLQQMVEEAELLS